MLLGLMYIHACIQAYSFNVDIVQSSINFIQHKMEQVDNYISKLYNHLTACLAVGYCKSDNYNDVAPCIQNVTMYVDKYTTHKIS